MEHNTSYRILPFTRLSGASGITSQEEILQAKLRLTSETTGVGLWEINLFTGEMIWDQQCKRIFGVTEDTAVTYEFFLSLLHPEDVTKVRATLWQAFFAARNEECNLAYRIIDPNGRLHFLSTRGQTVFAEIDGNRKASRFLATVLEVTDRVKEEEALRKTEKLAAAGKITAAIAHEINNPLEAIANLLYLARQAGSLDEVRDYLGLADQELTRVTSLTTQTLQFHRQSSKASPTDIGEICHSVLDLYGPRIGSKGIKVSLRLKSAPRVMAFASELRQIIANLVVNAVDAMPRGGDLSIRLRPATNPMNGTQGVRLTIADTGHGIAPTDLPHIFESFFTTKGESGTGLGLWVARQILEKHHGSLLVRTSQRPGKSGTVFSIFLPLASTNGLSLEQTRVA